MDRKQEIMEAAVRLFSKKGLAATTVNDIAKEAGVAKGSFYKSFESKDELLRQILDQYLVSLQGMTAYVSSLINLSPKEKLEKYCLVLLEHIIEQRQFFLSILSGHYGSAGWLENNNPFLAEFEKRILNMIKDFMIYVYGNEVKAYVWDVVIVSNSLFSEYATRLVNTNVSSAEVSRLIAHLVDMTVQQFHEKCIRAVITGELSRGLEMKQPPENKGNPIIELYRMLERKIHSLDADPSLKQEWKEILVYLKEELEASKPRGIILKSLLNYLSQQKELSELCSRLEMFLLHS